MKKLILIFAICLPIAKMMATTQTALDTVIVIDNKRIEINDSDNRMKVRVYDLNESAFGEEEDMVFEGHYRNGNSFEKRRIIGKIEVPKPIFCRHFEPHWDGFGMGFINFIDPNWNINNNNDITLRSGNSLEYNLNLFETAIPFVRNKLALVTGAGIRWSRYKLDGNVYLTELNGVTSPIPAWDGIRLTKSKLNINYFTFPLLLEWQIAKHRRDAKFYVSAGAVGLVKFSSSSKIEYRNERDKKLKAKMDEGMNLLPISVDLMAQIGFKDVSAYVRYSPISLFEKGKGPHVYPVAAGLHLHF